MNPGNGHGGAGADAARGGSGSGAAGDAEKPIDAEALVANALERGLARDRAAFLAQAVVEAEAEMRARARGSRDLPPG